MKALVLADSYKKETVEFSNELIQWFQERAIFAIAPPTGEEIQLFREFDLAVLLGGDGFITRKSLVLAKLGIPFLAINFGTKGFLAVAEKENWREVLEKVVRGEYGIEKRLILAATYFGRQKIRKFQAAGDIYVRHRTNMIILDVVVDGILVYENLSADGIIVTTPTGATGYNLSAGGPILESGMAVTPICPHAVNVKPLQVNEGKVVEILYRKVKTYQEDEGCLLFVDGTKYPIESGDKILIQKLKKKAFWIIPTGFSFFEALQKKLGLSK